MELAKSFMQRLLRISKKFTKSKEDDQSLNDAIACIKSRIGASVSYSLPFAKPITDKKDKRAGVMYLEYQIEDMWVGENTDGEATLFFHIDINGKNNIRRIDYNGNLIPQFNDLKQYDLKQ